MSSPISFAFRHEVAYSELPNLTRPHCGKVCCSFYICMQFRVWLPPVDGLFRAIGKILIVPFCGRKELFRLSVVLDFVLVSLLQMLLHFFGHFGLCILNPSLFDTPGPGVAFMPQRLQTPFWFRRPRRVPPPRLTSLSDLESSANFFSIEGHTQALAHSLLNLLLEGASLFRGSSRRLRRVSPQRVPHVPSDYRG